MIQGIFEVDVCQKGIICIRKIKKGLVVKQQEKENGRNAQNGRLEQIDNRDRRCSQIKGQKSLTILSQLQQTLLPASLSDCPFPAASSLHCHLLTHGWELPLSICM